jgi:8-oxo-dGTP pyrophosphatase MutT (NUDIX family)
LADDHRTGVLRALADHTPTDPKERADRDHIAAFVRAHPDCFGKRNPVGHLTGSAFVVDDRGRVLLHHHRKLQRWLQVGGHTEPDELDVADTALREAREESGLEDLVFHPALGRRPVDVDVHRIPARAHEPAHDHLDLRYVVFAPNPDAIRCSEESDDLRWFSLDGLKDLGFDAALRRALAKTAALGSEVRP